MLTIKNGTIKSLAAAIVRAKILPKERLQSQVEADLINLRDGPEAFGEVDLRNRQQVALVAHRVKDGVEKKKVPVINRVRKYSLVVVGAGSTAAYYLDTLGPAHAKAGTLVIGKENPWINERGHGISYVNHTSRQVALPSRNETRYGGNESFVNRKQFGTTMQQRVRQLAGRVVEDFVTSIKRVVYNEKTVLELTCQKESNGPFYADRVVFVAGAGESRKPKVDSQYKQCVIDMNTFIRDKAATETPGRVVIWGSNAAIDAAAAAKKHGWTIAAWLYSKGTSPAWLPGTRYLSAPYELDKVRAYEYEGRDAIQILDGSPNRVNVHDGKAGKRVANNVKYLVYGLGTEDLLSKVMDPSVLDGELGLAPILDEQGVFSSPWDPRPEAKAFLGWGTKDGMLVAFGLAAENYELPNAKDDKKTRINSISDRRVQALKKWLSGDVLTVGQLTYIRSAMRAVNNYVPGSIEHRVDFSHADANQLRIHLAAKYPDIPEPLARWFIGMISDLRTDEELQDRLPHGFTARQTTFIERKLAAMQRYGKQFSTDFETMPKALSTMTPPKGQQVQTGLRKLAQRKLDI